MLRQQVLKVLAGTFVVVLAGVMPASAQVVTGTVAGTVTDAQGGVLPGATVVLISESRGTKMVPAITNAQGDFVVPNMTADTYTLEITMSGFKMLRRNGISVSAGDRFLVPGLTLEVGGTTETVNVTAEAPPLQAQSGERSFVATSEQVQNLPFSNRSFTALANITPGVDGTNRIGGGGTTNTLMDGVSTVDTGNNAALLQLNTEAIAEVKVLVSNYQAEYGRASGLQISAVTKSGSNRFHGSLYDVMRDSDWNSNSWANKKNGNPKTVSEQQDWGYTLGGPMGRPGGNNKLFFFFAQEWRPRSAGNNISQFRFPTAAERAGDFSQTLDNNGNLYNLIRDASTNLTCSATNNAGCFQDGGIVGKIPANRLYPIGLNVLKQYPMPNITPGERPGVGYNYEITRPIENYLNNQRAIRVDYQPWSSLRGTFKYAGEVQRPQTFNGSLPGFNDTRTHDPVVTTLSGTINYTITPSTFLEGTFGYSRNAVAGCVDIFSNCTASIMMSPASNKNNSGLGDLPVLFPDGLKMDPRYYEYGQLEKIGTPFFQNGTILLPPTFAFGNRVSNGPPSLPYPSWLNFNRNLDLQISLTKVTGQHTIKAGFYNQHSRKAQNRGSGGPGSLSFANNTSNPIDSTYGFANAALGIFNSYTQLSRFMEGSYVYYNTEGFIQDNWKVSRRLTLDYGVRFVRMQPQYDEFLQASNFLPETWSIANAPVLYTAGCVNNVFPCSGNNRQARNPLTGQLLGPNSTLAIGALVPNTGDPLNGIRLSGEGIVKTGHKYPLVKPAPRVGFAYDVTGSQEFVIRGGGGLFFDRRDGNTVYGLVANPPNAKSVTVNYGQLQTLGASGLAVQGPPALITYEYESKYPSSAQWNGGIQMTLPWASSLDLEYVGQHGFNLLQGVDINQVDIGAAFLTANIDATVAPTVPGANAVLTDQMRAIRGYGSINQQWSRNWNTYHSVQSTFNRRFRSGVSFQVNYTLGLSNIQPAGARLEHDASGNLKYRSDQAKADELLGQAGLNRHTIRGNFVWDLPDIQSTSNPVVNIARIVANDWQLSGIFRGGSGDRYSIGYGYQNGGGSVNLTGSPNYGSRVVINGATGSGCSDNQYKQFDTSVFRGPSVGSDGLESGQNYLIGCPQAFWDFAIARNIRMGGGRNLQLRVDVYNAFNTVAFTGRNTTMNLTSPTDPVTITNPQYDLTTGELISTRLLPNNAGFGAVTGASALRSVQGWIRFSF